jgi:hypothetical protein
MSNKKSSTAQLASELTPNSRNCEAENLKKLDQLPNLPKTSAAQNLACKFDSVKNFERSKPPNDPKLSHSRRA